jgi:polysaccharide export outer membrane protein
MLNRGKTRMELRLPLSTRRTLSRLGAFLLALSLAGSSLAAQSGKSGSSKAPEVLEYVIGSGDVLQVFVWKEPDLTREVTVRLDGRITVPLLGDVQAAGQTPLMLSAEITKQLTKFLAAPQVTVGISQANSTRFFVVGQVARPGEFPLTAGTTLVQALALAGGFREFAKTDGIVIVRQQANPPFVSVNYKKLEDKSDITQNVLIRARDTIVVP